MCFCKPASSFDKVRAIVETTLSIILTKNTASDVGTLLEGVYSGVFISVFDEHGLEDDCGINFSNYDMEIDFKETENDLAIIHMAINLANSIHNQLNCDTMVVRNFQHLIVELEVSSRLPKHAC